MLENKQKKAAAAQQQAQPAAPAFHGCPGSMMKQFHREPVSYTHLKNLSLSQRIFCTTPKTVRGRLLTYFSAQAARCGRMEFRCV